MTAASGLQELRLNNLSLEECVVALPSLQVLSLDSSLPATMDWVKGVRPLGRGTGRQG